MEAAADWRLVHTSGHLDSAPPGERVLMVLVGLPGTGKSYLSRKVQGYFSWLGYKARVFNVGNHRREAALQCEQKADFFAPDNESARQLRDKLALDVLQSALDWLEGGGELAILDATNTTAERRQRVCTVAAKHSAAPQVLFVESICEDKDVLEANMRQKIGHSPDYKGWPEEKAMDDLSKRIENYRRVYELIEDDSLSYIKCINLQSKVVANRLEGSTQHRLLAYLTSIHIHPRPVYLMRAGDSEHVRTVSNFSAYVQQQQDQIEGEVMLSGFSLASKSTAACTLSKEGQAFAELLPSFFQQQGARALKVYTSPLRRAIHTAERLPGRSQQWAALNMMDTGICHGKSVAQIRMEMPDEYNKFLNDPFHYRMPGGESIHDCVRGLDPLIVDMERQRSPVVVVSHLSTLQLLYGYFMALGYQEALQVPIATHTIIKLIPEMYGWTEERYALQGNSMVRV